MNLYVPGLLKTCENCVPTGSLPLVLLKVSGPEETSTLWPPPWTSQVTDSPWLIDVVVSDPLSQAIVAEAASAAGAATANVGRPAVRARGIRIGGVSSMSVSASVTVRVAEGHPRPPGAGLAHAGEHPSSGPRTDVSCRAGWAAWEGRGVLRVLLADDHPMVRAGLRQLLGAEPDIEVVGAARDGREALELVAREGADVVLMDLSMP